MGLGAAGAGIAAGLGGLGVGATTAGIIGSVAAPALVGAGVGAAGSAIEGGDPGQGALFGGLTGGAVGGLGGVVGGGLGIGATAGDALVGAGTGALLNGIEGQNPLTGALEGGVGGALQGALSGSPTDATAGAATAPGGASAAGLAGGPTGDLTGATYPIASIGEGTPLAAPTAGTDGLTGVSAPFSGSVTPLSNMTVPAGASAAAPSIGSPGTPVSGAGAAGFDPSASAGGGGGFFGASDPVTDSAASTGGGFFGTPTATGEFPGGNGGLMSQLGAKLTDPKTLVSAAPLIMSTLKGNNVTGMSQLQGQAGQLSAQGQQMQQYLQNGTLPPGVAQAVQLAQKQGEASIRSKYASMGQSGSTAETTELASLRQQSAAQGYQTALQLFQQGMSETNLSSEIYSTLMNTDEKQSQQTGSAIANFAAALAGTSPGKAA